MAVDKYLEVINATFLGKEIASFCIQPRTSSEIRRLYEDESTGIVTRDDVSTILRILEQNDVIKFENGKWVTTPPVRKIIEQYF